MYVTSLYYILYGYICTYVDVVYIGDTYILYVYVVTVFVYNIQKLLLHCVCRSGEVFG